MKKIIVLIVLLCLAGFAHAELITNGDFEAGMSDWGTWGSGSGSAPYAWIGSQWGTIIPSDGSDGGQYMELSTTFIENNYSSWGWAYEMVYTSARDVGPVSPGQELLLSCYAREDLTVGAIVGMLFEWVDFTGMRVDYDGDGVRWIQGDPCVSDENNHDRTSIDFPPLTGSGWEQITATHTVPILDLLGGTIDPPITGARFVWVIGVGWPEPMETVGLDELSVSIAGVVNIYPPNGEEYVLPSVVLEWDRPVAYDPNAYDVYLTTDPNANKPEHLVVDGVLQTTYDPSPDLEFNTWYYWRVNAYDANCTEACEWPFEGPVWSFKTMPAEPVFTTDAEHALVPEGGSAVFYVLSPNADPCDFQWYKEPSMLLTPGGDISIVSDATSSTLTISNVETADEDFYYCRATNQYDSTDSSHAKIEIEKLLAHWTMDSPLVLDQYVDETGNHDADPNKPSAVSFTNGIIGGALGAVEMDVFRWARAGNWRPNEYGGQMTVSAWIKVPDTNDITGDGQGIVSKRVGDSFDWALYVRNGDAGHPGDNYVRFSSWNTGDVWAGPDAVDPENPDWVFVAATVDGTGAGRLYINGEVQAVDDEWTFGTNESADILIGKGNPEQYVFPGMIDDVKIFNYARDSYQIAADYTDVAGGSVCAEIFPGDYNGDCEVNLADVAELALIWRNCNIIPPEACP